MSRRDESTPHGSFEGEAQPYALYDLVRPVGSSPVPASFGDAERADAQARSAYEGTDYVRAAELFMEAAALLRCEPEQPHATTLTADRSLAYRNAALAWAMADRLDDGVAALRALIAAEPGADAVVTLVLEDLPAPVRAREPG